VARKGRRDRRVLQHWRFDKFMDRGRLLLNTFPHFKTMCEKAIEDEKRPRAAAVSAAQQQNADEGEAGQNSGPEGISS
jgi:hypothetical protein